jgi:hypothetical protein
MDVVCTRPRLTAADVCFAMDQRGLGDDALEPVENI